MYTLEILLVVAALALLAAQTMPRIGRTAAVAGAALALSSIALSLVLGQARWQMAPAYLLFVILALLLLKRSYAHVVLRSIAMVFGVLLVGLAATLALALPIVTLPAPDGPRAVGVRSFALRDESRSEAYFKLPDERREISVQVWYPGTIDPALPPPSTRTLWAELYSGPPDPVTFFMGYLRGIETHSYQDLTPATTAAPYPVIVYSHSFGPTAEQNTPLMEHLASHGYVVVGITHTRMALRALSPQGRVVYADPDRFREAFADSTADRSTEFDRRAASAASAAERAEIVYDLGERAKSMNEQVAIRVADVRFVLDVIANPTMGPAEFAALLKHVDAERIGLLGMSLGGATVIEVCKIEPRCRAGVNLDGNFFGQYQRRPLPTPFMSMVSASNQRFAEHLLLNSTSDYYEVLVEGAEHSDFFDMTFLMPFMKWVGANGPIDAMRMIELVNLASLEFFDAHLRGGPKPRFDAPELRVITNAGAAN